MQEIYLRQDIVEAYTSVKNTIDSLFAMNGTGFLVEDNNGVLLHTRLQAIFNVKYDTLIKRALHELIVGHALSAEKCSAGGFDECLKMSLESAHKVFGVTTYHDNENSSEVNLSHCGTIHANRPTTQDVAWLINQYVPQGNTFVSKIIENAVLLAGRGGRIVVEKSANLNASVELTSGHTFSFVKTIGGMQNISFENPRVTCIDGFIETIPEIHRLLEEASEVKEPLILLTRGFGDDVLQTLKVNYDNGRLQVIPIVVSSDIDDINILIDIAAVCECNVLNTQSGEMTNSVRFLDAPRVDKVTLFGNKMIFLNKKSVRRINAHVKFLQEKRKAQEVEDVQKIFDKRIKNMTPNHVIIRIPDDHMYVKNVQMIDYTLRALNALVKYGTITNNNQKSLASTYLAAKKHSLACIKTLKSLGAMMSSTT
jgi:chaperonin GroEL (HSP60 family)